MLQNQTGTDAQQETWVLTAQSGFLEDEFL
jgi:hypothetical protein